MSVSASPVPVDVKQTEEGKQPQQEHPIEDVVVLHPGSSELIFGTSLQDLPHSIPHCCAILFKPQQQQQPLQPPSPAPEANTNKIPDDFESYYNLSEQELLRIRRELLIKRKIKKEEKEVQKQESQQQAQIQQIQEQQQEQQQTLQVEDEKEEEVYFEEIVLKQTEDEPVTKQQCTL